MAPFGDLSSITFLFQLACLFTFLPFFLNLTTQFLLLQSFYQFFTKVFFSLIPRLYPAFCEKPSTFLKVIRRHCQTEKTANGNWNFITLYKVLFEFRKKNILLTRKKETDSYPAKPFAKIWNRRFITGFRFFSNVSLSCIRFC